MKNTTFLSLTLVIFLASCKPATPEQEETKEAPPTPAQTEDSKQCFAYDKDDNLIGLTITTTGDQVSGHLAYAYSEKDRNGGTVTGVMRGDTLILEYTFASEGRKSIREVVFLKRDNALIEGFGDVEEREGKMVFKSRANLTFDGKMPLQSVPCHK